MNMQSTIMMEKYYTTDPQVAWQKNQERHEFREDYNSPGNMFWTSAIEDCRVAISGWLQCTNRRTYSNISLHRYLLSSLIMLFNSVFVAAIEKLYYYGIFQKYSYSAYEIVWDNSLLTLMLNWHDLSLYMLKRNTKILSLQTVSNFEQNEIRLHEWKLCINEEWCNANSKCKLSIWYMLDENMFRLFTLQAYVVLHLHNRW